MTTKKINQTELSPEEMMREFREGLRSKEEEDKKMKDFTIEFIFHNDALTTSEPTVGWKFANPDTRKQYGDYIKLDPGPVSPEMIIEAIKVLAVQAIRTLDMVQRGIDDTNTKI